MGVDVWGYVLRIHVLLHVLLLVLVQGHILILVLVLVLVLMLVRAHVLRVAGVLVLVPAAPYQAKDAGVDLCSIRVSHRS